MKQYAFLSLLMVMSIHALNDEAFDDVLPEYTGAHGSQRNESGALYRWEDDKKEKPCECDLEGAFGCLVGTCSLIAFFCGSCP